MTESNNVSVTAGPLRSTMGEARLNSLAHMYINRDLELDYDSHCHCRCIMYFNLLVLTVTGITDITRFHTLASFRHRI